LVGVSLFTLLVVGLTFYGFTVGYTIERQQQQLLDAANEVAELAPDLFANGDGAEGRAAPLSSLLNSQLRGLPSGAGIALFRSGTMVATAGSLPERPVLKATLRAEAELLVRTERGATVIPRLLDGQPKAKVILAAAEVDLPSGRGIVAAIVPASAAARDRGALVRLLLIPGGIAVGVSLFLGFGLGSWLTRPLRRLVAAARTMAGGGYDQPVSGTYPGEMQELAGSLEWMRQEVKRSDDSLRGFVGAAAHELRTPLTSIQGFAQALLDGTVTTPEQRRSSSAAIYRESARLRRLVDALLMLSRYDSREFRPNFVSLDVCDLVREEIERLEQAGLAEPGRVTLGTTGNTTALTDADMFRQIAANLLRNAVQYGGEEPVEVSVSVGGGRLVLRVENGGPPLSPQERDNLFNRFYRGAAARRTDGLGLGLPVVREICRVLGGSVQLDGTGPRTVFVADLPVGPK